MARLYTGSEEVDEIATIVGFGKTGNGLTGDILPAGDKRAGINLIGGLGDVIGYSTSSLLADFDIPDPLATGKAVSLDLEYLAAPGDSGGGWFLDMGGQSYLAGVTSFGFAPDDYLDFGYGDIMCATRIGDYMSWISSIVILPIAGDYNHDGTVDAADYVLWRSESSSYRGAQGYTDWVSNFGQTAGSGSSISSTSVPEPARELLLILGVAFGICVGRRFGSRVQATHQR